MGDGFENPIMFGPGATVRLPPVDYYNLPVGMKIERERLKEPDVDPFPQWKQAAPYRHTDTSVVPMIVGVTFMSICGGTLLTIVGLLVFGLL